MSSLLDQGLGYYYLAWGFGSRKGSFGIWLFLDIIWQDLLPLFLRLFLLVRRLHLLYLG